MTFGYGPPEVVHVAEVPRPDPAAREVLVRVHAAAVTSGDARIRGARFPAGFGPFVRLVFGITRPRRRILGGSFSGVVDAVGADVAGLSPGLAVCGMTGDLAATDSRFDVVLDCVGNLTITSGRHLLAEGGVLLLAVASLWDNIRAHGNVAAGSAPERVADMELLIDLVAKGDITVVHDGDYDLEHIVDAYRRVDSGHKRGNVIVHPGGPATGCRDASGGSAS